jgi:hypothetical protein
MLMKQKFFIFTLIYFVVTEYNIDYKPNIQIYPKSYKGYFFEGTDLNEIKYNVTCMPLCNIILLNSTEFNKYEKGRYYDSIYYETNVQSIEKINNNLEEIQSKLIISKKK